MRKIKRLLPFALSLILLSSCGAPGSSSLGYRQISMNEAVKIMKDEKNYIILEPNMPRIVRSSSREMQSRGDAAILGTADDRCERVFWRTRVVLVAL